MAFCTKCGKELNSTDRFCFHCGAPVPEQGVPAQPEPNVPTKPEPSVPVQPEPNVPTKPEPSVPVQPGPNVPSQPEPSVPAQPEPNVPGQPGQSVPIQPERGPVPPTAPAGNPTAATPGSAPTPPVGNTPSPQPSPQPAPYRPPQQPSQQPPQQPGPVYPGYKPTVPQTTPKKKNKALPFLIAGGVVLALVVIIFVVVPLIRSLLHLSDPEPAPPVVSQPESSVAEVTPEPDFDIDYTTYANNEVSFSLEYPEGCTLSEPDMNNVLIGDGDDFRLAAEYAFFTQSDGFIYSAADFAAQIDADLQVLSDYVGADVSGAKGPESMTLGGRDAYCYRFSMKLSAGDYTCALYLIQGKGDFGCYTLQTAYRADCDKADQYAQQCAHAAESFQVTAAYQNPDLGVYTFEDLEGLSFMVRNEAANKVSRSNNMDAVSVYPLAGKATKANIWIHTSEREDSQDVTEVLQDLSKAGFVGADSHSNGFPLPVHWPVGRYPFTQMDTEFIEDGETFTQRVIAFTHNGHYWYIRAENIPEYEDIIQAALSDIIFSLRFGDEAGTAPGQSKPASSPASTPAPTSDPVDINRAVVEIMNELSTVNGYYEESYAPNKISVTDLNGDGCYEVLALYQTKESDGTFMVRGELCSIRPDGSRYGVAGFTIFQPVGGNNGSISLSQNSAGTLCVHLYEQLMNGTSSRDVYDSYYPLSENELSLNEKAAYRMHAFSIYNDEMSVISETYDRDEQVINQATYRSALGEYTDVVVMNLYGESSGSVMSFADAQTYDFNRNLR